MLSPDDIAGREFRVARRGYDRDEVHAFLAGVAAHVAELEQRVAEAEASRAASPPEGATDAPAAPAPSPDDASRVFAEIGQETQRILEAAREAAKGIARKAEADAAEEVAAARRRADEVLAEGERRRDAVERVIAELEQSRAEIAADLRATQRTIEQTLRELLPRRAGATVREALSDEARRRGARESAAGEATRAPDAAAEPGAQSQTAEAPADAGTPANSGTPAGADSAGPAPDAPRAAGADEPGSDTGAVPAEPAGRPVSEDDDDTDPGPPPLASSRPLAGPSAAPVGVGPDAPRVRVVTAPASSPRSPRSGPPGAAAQAGASAGAAGRTGADRAEEPLALRSAALESLHRRTVRRVKRGLGELETATLERVRRPGGSQGGSGPPVRPGGSQGGSGPPVNTGGSQGGSGLEQEEATSLLPLDEELMLLSGPAAEQLQGAYRAGVKAAATLVGRPLPPPEGSRDFEEALRSDASRRIRNGLLGSLRAGIDAGEDLDALADRVRTVFADLRRSAADELAAAHLVHAYELGLLDAWAAAGVPARSWVLGPEPRCPESRCRQNERVGPLDVGEVFPSGHDVPPIHVGCTCTTVPLLSGRSSDAEPGA